MIFDVHVELVSDQLQFIIRQVDKKEPIQPNSTFCPKHQTGKGRLRLRRD